MCRLDDKERRNQDVDEDFLFHVTEFFNPISLFHVFLAEVSTAFRLYGF